MLNLAAAAGGAAANVAINKVADMMRPTPPPRNARRQPQMTVAVPRNQPRRRKQRASNSNNNGLSMARQITPGSSIRVVDTEYLTVPSTTLNQMQFNPAPPDLARLEQFSKMYHRFKINRITVHYEPGVGTATTGNISMGICVGPPLGNITTSAHIMKLTPSCFVPAWKSGSITVGRDIDIGRYMICGGTGDTSVACTLYTLASAANLGLFRVTYDVSFSYPVNF